MDIKDVKEFGNLLPDVYFDWYARFIPGSIGVALYYQPCNKMFDATVTNLVLHGFLAYVIGHLVQPMAGFVVKRLEMVTKSDHDKRYALAKSDPKCESKVKKASKAHAEANSMCAIAIIMSIMMICKLSQSSIWMYIAIAYCCLMTIERVYARKRKILDLPENSKFNALSNTDQS
jgi:hypothetical protein